MLKTLTIAGLTALFALGAAGRTRADVTVTRVNYHGWEGAYQLSNKTVELVFVPQIGRVMRYGYADGANVLWENTKLSGQKTDFTKPVTAWNNYGGDKLWPAPQSRWGWPPDPTFESAPQTVEISPSLHLIVTSPVSAKHGLRFKREIALDATGVGVTFTNTLVNTSGVQVDWSVWEITQVDDPTVVRMPRNKGGRFPAGYYVFGDSAPQPEMVSLSSDTVSLRRSPTQTCKIGTDSPAGQITMEKGGLQFTVASTYEILKEYPDEGCALEVYTNNDPDKYVELELLGPIRTLQASQETVFVTHWSLSR